MDYRIKNAIKRVLFKSGFGHNLYALVSKKVQASRRDLNDREYVIKAFHENTGKTLNLDHPITFNDKLLWLSINDHDPMKTKCADKYRVREYIQECGYGYILSEL